MSSPNPSSPNPSSTDYCERCGRPADAADHAACDAARALEPPRYCTECGRRTVVKVTPHGWSSRCTRHGLTTSTPAA
jgi:ribosomal protein L37E